MDKFSHLVGTNLPNGATILRIKEGVVLALLVCNRVTPFVTWAYNGNDLSSTYWGHYFDSASLDVAIADYEERV